MSSKDRMGMALLYARALAAFHSECDSLPRVGSNDSRFAEIFAKLFLSETAIHHKVAALNSTGVEAIKNLDLILPSYLIDAIVRKNAVQRGEVQQESELTGRRLKKAKKKFLKAQNKLAKTNKVKQPAHKKPSKRDLRKLAKVRSFIINEQSSSVGQTGPSSRIRVPVSSSSYTGPLAPTMAASAGGKKDSMAATSRSPAAMFGKGAARKPKPISASPLVVSDPPAQ